MIHPDYKDDEVVEFSSLAVGDQYWYATRPKAGHEPFTKEEDIRRPYTGQSNASFFWRNVNDKGIVMAEGRTFLYTNVYSKVVKRPNPAPGYALLHQILQRIPDAQMSERFTVFWSVEDYRPKEGNLDDSRTSGGSSKSA